MDTREIQPVLVLGAGINGAAVARELVLNGVPVWVVDANDIAFGATSRSSRLIHGGLRYLEYGDFSLVRESLAERSRLLQLAPQFIEPLELYIPVRRRTGGLVRSVLRFLGGSRRGVLQKWAAAWPGTKRRGLWLVRLGLWFYDRLAADERFPKHRVHSAGQVSVPKVDAGQFPWLCAYADAQMCYPERFVLALLEDARQAAQQNGTEFRVLTYHHATLHDGLAEIRRRRDDAPLKHCLTDADEAVARNEIDCGVRQAVARPPLIVNATGAWGDFTLKELSVPSPRLFGGTKGSHFVTHNERLREALDGVGIYAEAADGRLVFVLPFGDNVLVGTTDERFEDRPERAVATEDELNYLLQMVNALFAGVALTPDDIDMHYSGVRPLPYIPIKSSGAIPRGHSIDLRQSSRHDPRAVRDTTADIPILTLIGGKLTTCRAFAEEVADLIFSQVGVPRTTDTRRRPIPGGENYPPDREALRQEWRRLAEVFALDVAQIRAIWSLCGNRTEPILRECLEASANAPAAPLVAQARSQILHGTQFPLAYVRWVIEHEWVTTLDDLIERRLMLLYEPDLSEACLRQLADCLVDADRLSPSAVNDAVRATVARVRSDYGKRIVGESAADAAS